MLFSLPIPPFRYYSMMMALFTPVYTHRSPVSFHRHDCQGSQCSAFVQPSQSPFTKVQKMSGIVCTQLILGMAKSNIPFLAQTWDYVYKKSIVLNIYNQKVVFLAFNFRQVIAYSSLVYIRATKLFISVNIFSEVLNRARLKNLAWMMWKQPGEKLAFSLVFLST